ncbi:MAG TPA: efflux RND transporter periplasmic adaptor subunit, partial [Catalimonadaceae bacterium]|nr:efflux RND transporter periplasmic adaptor subunit [Catalimonadaceae bacterium]
LVSPAQMQSAGIVTGPIERKNMSAILEVNGILDVPPQNMVSISTMMGGFVLRTKLLQGLAVAKGEELVVLQNPEYIALQQDYLANKSKLQFLETETSRQSELSAEKVTATKIYQQSLSELNSLKAMQAGLKERLKLLGFDLAQIDKGRVSSELVIRSPITGNVTQVGINLGKYVQPQDLICEIVNTTHLHAELTVFEQDLPKIKVGQHIHFNLINEPEKIRTAHLYLINKKMNPDRTVRVHAHLDEEDKGLIPNQILKAKIETSEAEMDVLPEESIVDLHGRHYVFALMGKDRNGNDLFKKVEVKPGISQNGFTQIQLVEKLESSLPIAIKGARDILALAENKDEE